MDEEYKEMFQEALNQRHHHKIDERLSAVDKIWNNGPQTTDDCKRDSGVNHLKKKIWALYSLFVDQLHREGEEAVYLDAVEPDISKLSKDIAEEMMDDMVSAVKEGQVEISFDTFMTLFGSVYRKHLRLLMMRAEREVTALENELQETMFSGNNLAEIKRGLLDLAMYPNMFMLAAYKTVSTENEFKFGRLHAKEKEIYSFKRINPWNVFPCESRSTMEGCTNYFIIEDYCKSAIRKLKDIKGVNKRVINEVLKYPEKYSIAWYANTTNCRHFPDLSASMKDIPILKYIGLIDGEQGEKWFIGDEEVYSSKGEDDAVVVLTDSFRPSNDSVYGTGTVDIGWRLQKVLDELSEMMVQNIGHRAKPGGLIPTSLARRLVKQLKQQDGGLGIDYKRIYEIPDDQWLRGYTIRAFDIPDRSQQIQASIEIVKREMDSLLAIPGFADGSQNVGTVGRSYQGMFLLQSNMMMSIKAVWTHVAENVLVKIAQRVINGRLLADDAEPPTLDFSVRVRPFYMQDEALEDADSLIKRIQAIVSLQQTGLVQPQAEQLLVDEALDKLGVNTDAIPVVDSQELAPPELPAQQGTEQAVVEAEGNVFR